MPTPTRIVEHTRRRIAHLVVVSALSTAWSILPVPAAAQQSSIFDTLLEKLKDKGVLTPEEYDALKQARDEERVEQRAERRKEALKAAQEEERKEKAKEEDKTALKGKFNNGFTWETIDKRNSITVSGRIQADYRAFSPEGTTSGSSTPTTTGFDIRRAYLGVQGRLAEYYTFDVTANFASLTNNSHLDVAWINAEWIKWAQLRIGQFKMPYSLEEMTSSRFIDYTERSLLNQFVPAKERGAMVWGAPGTGFTYGVALSNGQGQNSAEVNSVVDGQDVIGRVTANFAEMLKQKDNIYHVGLEGTYGTLPTANNGQGTSYISVRTEGRGMTFFQVPQGAFTGDEVERQRLGLEAAVAFGPFKLQGEYMDASFSGTSFVPGTTNPGISYNRNVYVYYLSAGWWVTGETWASAYRNGVFGRIIPKNNLRIGDSGWGALMLGFRYSYLDGSDFKPAGTGPNQNPVGTGTLGAGLTNKAEAYTFGATWVVAPNLRFYLDYIQTEFDTPVRYTPSGGTPQTTNNEKAVNFRAGIDF